MTKAILVRHIDEQMIMRYNTALSEYKSKSCEFSYANLYAWQDEYNTKMFDCKNFFAVAFEIEGHDVFLPPIAKNADFNVFFEFVKQHTKASNKQKMCFSGFSKDEAQKLEKVVGKSFFHEDRGNFDYLYDVQQISTLSGKKLHSKKNHVNKFLSLYKDRYTFEQMNADNAKECIQFNRLWEEQNKDFINESLIAESKSAKVLLENFDRFSLVGAIIKVDGNIAGYTVGEQTYPGSDTLCIHIEKGLYSITGVYPMLFSSFVKSFEDTFLYVNREDDLDDEGLRYSKLSYNPCAFVEKYGGEMDL